MKRNGISVTTFIRNGFGRRIAQLGELLNCSTLIYNPLVMRHFHETALLDAPIVSNALLTTFPHATRIVDVGSGSGAFSAGLIQRGCTVVALERSPHGRALAKKQGVSCRNFDLTDSPPAILNETFDLAICFEVAEHLTPELGEKLLGFLCGLKTPIVFSAAHPGQGGTGHINEQLPQYWINRFGDLGLLFDANSTEGFRSMCAEGNASKWFRCNPIILRPANR